MTTTRRAINLFVLSTLVSTAAVAATRTWTGNGPNDLWHTPTNWSQNTVPVAGDTAIIDNSELWTVVLEGTNAEVEILEIQGVGTALDIKGVRLTLGDDANLIDTESVVNGTIRFFKVGSARAEISVRKWVKFSGGGAFQACGTNNPEPYLAKFTRAATSARGVHFEKVNVFGNIEFLVSVKHNATFFQVDGRICGESHMRFGSLPDDDYHFDPPLEISDVSPLKDREFVVEKAYIVFYKVAFASDAPDWRTAGDEGEGGTFVVDDIVVNNPPNDIIISRNGFLEVNVDFTCNGTLSQKGTIRVKGGKIAKFEP